MLTIDDLTEDFKLYKNDITYSTNFNFSGWNGITERFLRPNTVYLKDGIKDSLSAKWSDALDSATKTWGDYSQINITKDSDGQNANIYVYRGTFDEFRTAQGLTVRFNELNGSGPTEGINGSEFEKAEIAINNRQIGKIDKKFGFDKYVLLHEIGHALGLKGDDDLPDGTTADMTVMSYNRVGGRYPTTPMAYDIEAIESIYGHKSTNGNNNTYSINNNFFDGRKHSITIKDDGGIDEFDLSDYEKNTYIDLRQALGENNEWLDQKSVVGRQNIYLAKGTIIENATGSKMGNDEIIGNSSNNILRGLGGKDELNGGEGSDQLEGGDGKDRYIFNGKPSEIGHDIISDSDGQGTIIINGKKVAGKAVATADFTGWTLDDYSLIPVGDDVAIVASSNDTITIKDFSSGEKKLGITLAQIATANADTLKGTKVDDVIDGLEGSDTISGGKGNDILTGGAGEDSLKGGNDNDTLDGGADVDTLEGERGVDTLRGGEGDDILVGGRGDDILFGDAGNDEYRFDGNRGKIGHDIISDSDDEGKLIINGKVIEGTAEEVGENRWTLDGYNLSLNGDDLKLDITNRDSITILDFDVNNGALGIDLGVDEPPTSNIKSYEFSTKIDASFFGLSNFTDFSFKYIVDPDSPVSQVTNYEIRGAAHQSTSFWNNVGYGFFEVGDLKSDVFEITLRYSKNPDANFNTELFGVSGAQFSADGLVKGLDGNNLIFQDYSIDNVDFWFVDTGFEMFNNIDITNIVSDISYTDHADYRTVVFSPEGEVGIGTNRLFDSDYPGHGGAHSEKRSFSLSEIDMPNEIQSALEEHGIDFGDENLAGMVQSAITQEPQDILASAPNTSSQLDNLLASPAVEV